MIFWEGSSCDVERVAFFCHTHIQPAINLCRLELALANSSNAIVIYPDGYVNATDLLVEGHTIKNNPVERNWYDE